MVLLELDEQISVTVEKGSNKPCAYTVISNGVEVVSYETSADIRKPPGLIGVRNVIFQRISGYEKSEVEERLRNQLNRHESDINETMGYL